MMGSGYERRTEPEPPAGPRLRVYELAKDLNLTPKDLVAKIRAMGIEVANHMSHLEPPDVDRVRRAVERERLENLEEVRLNDTVIRRRSKSALQAAPVAAAPPAPAPVAKPVPRPRRRAPPSLSHRWSPRPSAVVPPAAKEPVVAPPPVVAPAPEPRPAAPSCRRARCRRRARRIAARCRDAAGARADAADGAHGSD